ncbi:hypothetical protein ACERII_09080 [Evansella sp. AB-rgal1]|uniref:hypothetical protein n=1 Tax=Evansella sp. AB-rgal1 TaxID=3242696 RepID=UPI00359E65B8
MFPSSSLVNLMQGIDTNNTKMFHLRPGQLFQGVITQIYPGQLAQLKLGGMTITAKLEAQLQKGSRYWFQVLGGDGLPRLKVLENVSPLEKNSAPLLQQIGLTKGEVQEKVMTELIRDQIPFSPKQVKDGIALVQQSSRNNQDSINLLIQLIKRGLPISKETFICLETLYSQQSFGETIGKLKNSLQDSGLFRTFPQLYHLLQNLHFRNVSSSDETVQIIKEQITTASLLHLFERVGLKGMPMNDSRDILSRGELLKNLLLEFLQHSSPSTDNRLQAEFLIHRLTALQLLSVENNFVLQQMVMQLPLYFMGRYRDLTIQWQGKRNTSGEINGDYCRILFFLEMSYLADVIVDIQIQNRIISVTVYNEREKPQGIIDDLVPTLKESLSKLDYKLSTVIWKQPKIDPPTFINKVNDYQGVDIRI